VISALLGLRARDYERLLADGHPLEPEALGGVYRGVSLGLPGWVDRLAWKTFVKAIVRDDGGVRGWNVRLEQTGLDGPVVYRTRGGSPLTFGHFAVRPAGRRVVLDYDVPRNGLDPVRFLTDPLVALEPGSARWLFGRTLFAGIPTPSFFVLERVGEVDHEGQARA
jgi:hypothetical protein